MATTNNGMTPRDSDGNPPDGGIVYFDVFRPGNAADRHVPSKNIPGSLRPYAHVLKAPARDFMNRLLPAGTEVLSLPENGSPIFEYTEENCRTKEYADLMSAVQFPSSNRWPQEMRDSVLDLVAHRQSFCSKIDTNLSGYTVQELEDFTDLVLDAAVGGEGATPAAGWRDEVRRCFSARLLKVKPRGLFTSAQCLAVVFATPFVVDADTGMNVPGPPDGRFLDVVMGCVRAAFARFKVRGRHIVTLGCGLEWGGDPSVWATEKECLVVSAAQDGRWRVFAPKVTDDSLTKIIESIVPFTYGEFVQRVQTIVDRATEISSVGISIAEVFDEMSKTCPDIPSIRLDSVMRACLDIQGRELSPYVVCRRKGDKENVYVVRREDYCPEYDELVKNRI